MPTPSLSDSDAVLFDLDGVLVDSRRSFTTSLNAALAAHGLPERPSEQLVVHLGPPMHQTMRELVGGDEDLVESCIAAYRARVREHGPEESRLYDGIAEAVRAIAAVKPVVVATSKPQPLAELLLSAHGLADAFTAIVGPALDARDEPKAATIDRALGHLPPSAAAVMVGDRRYDVIGAQAHGLPCVGVLWGVGDAAELRAAGAATLVEHPRELPPLVGA